MALKKKTILDKAHLFFQFKIWKFRYKKMSSAYFLSQASKSSQIWIPILPRP